MYFPKPVSYKTLDEIRDEILSASPVSPTTIAIKHVLDEYIRRVKGAMNDSGTVFYQP